MFWVAVGVLVVILVVLWWRRNVQKYNYLQFIGWVVNTQKYISLYFHTKNRSFVVMTKNGEKWILDEKEINNGKIVKVNGCNYRIVLEKNNM